MQFSRQECWSGLPFPSPGDLPYPGIEPWSPALQADALLSEPPEKSKPLGGLNKSMPGLALDQLNQNLCGWGLNFSVAFMLPGRFQMQPELGIPGLIQWILKWLHVGTFQGASEKYKPLGSTQELWCWNKSEFIVAFILDFPMTASAPDAPCSLLEMLFFFFPLPLLINQLRIMLF